ncbi:hypothetical protein M409DRAFT_55062 [Zasmidium cellare ATCC 36951]|uniref:2EXR domain-containing protein n=1 Tax=Zasmidium cellare ATCC 36951 TaxID=1080233 RepID=A0A6A6CGB0_ZASCE|nr:uncharacterized protein M409DRAFT_55062 [Zasmidium cellare ATCC 36951]KAF2166195.1 hypothetical protein M409DRAFT_55062 [Zasmidium cellare ATCC 36951]
MASAMPLAEDNTSQTTLPIAGQTGRPQKLDPKKTGFFDLPAELRNEIYAITLIRPRKLCIRAIGVDRTPKVRLVNTRIYTSVLRTCKTIYEEATPVLYGANTFLTSCDDTSWHFLNMIDRSLEHVRLFESTDTVQLEIWKRILAVKRHLMLDPDDENIGWRLGRAVHDLDQSRMLGENGHNAPASQMDIIAIASSVKEVRPGIARRCRTSEGSMPYDNIAILWLLATHAGLLIALTTTLALPTLNPLKANEYRVGFFDLPAEIRNRIYELALTRPRTLSLCTTFQHGRLVLRLNTTRIFPSILLACATTHREATPILYGANKFSVRCHDTAFLFLIRIGHSVKFVKALKIEWDACSVGMAALKFAVSLGGFDEPGHREAQWQIAVVFQELYDGGQRNFGKPQILDRFESATAFVHSNTTLSSCA